MLVVAPCEYELCDHVGITWESTGNHVGKNCAWTGGNGSLTVCRSSVCILSVRNNSLSIRPPSIQCQSMTTTPQQHTQLKAQQPEQQTTNTNTNTSTKQFVVCYIQHTTYHREKGGESNVLNL